MAENWTWSISKMYTTVKDQSLIQLALKTAKTTLLLVLTELRVGVDKRLCRNDEFLNTYARDLVKQLRQADGGFTDYNAIIGEDVSRVLRYDTGSLLTIQWGDLNILLFKCPPNPLYPLEPPNSDQVSDIDSLKAQYAQHITVVGSQQEILKSILVVKEYAKHEFKAVTFEQLKTVIAENVAVALLRSKVNCALTVQQKLDEVELCKVVRSRLAEVTNSFRWGIIAGAHFGCEIDCESQQCELMAEYRVNYTLNGSERKLHLLVYSKAGIYVPTLSSLLTQFRRAISGVSFVKSLCFCLLIFCYLWFNSACRKYANPTEAVEPEDTFLPMTTLCGYKNSVLFSFALMCLAIFTGGSLTARMRNRRQRKLR